jgi:hypothetical protein
MPSFAPRVNRTIAGEARFLSAASSFGRIVGKSEVILPSTIPTCYSCSLKTWFAVTCEFQQRSIAKGQPSGDENVIASTLELVLMMMVTEGAAQEKPS